jgi:hypothetical protein
MRFSFIVVATTLSLCAAPCSYAGSETGAQFLESCGAAERLSDGKEAKSNEELISAIFCTGYISGFLDSLSVITTVTRANPVICLPSSGITNDQAIRIFLKFLRSNPEVLHESGRTSLAVSLRSAFPCK